MFISWLKKKILKKGKIMEDDIKHEDLENLDNDILEVEEVEEVEETEEIKEVVENDAPAGSGNVQGGKGKCRRA